MSETNFRVSYFLHGYIPMGTKDISTMPKVGDVVTLGFIPCDFKITKVEDMGGSEISVAVEPK